MMSGTSVLVFILSLMSFINNSYLIATVELPSIHDKTFTDYFNNIKTATETAMDKQLTDEEFKMILHGRLLSEDQFDKTLKNYNQYTDTINTNNSYKEIDKELTNFTDETRILKRLASIPGCGDSLKVTVEKYIQLRIDHKKKEQEKSSPSTEPEKTETSSSTEPQKVEVDDEEIIYLKSILPLTSSTGRIRSLLLNTLYGNSHNQIKATANSLRSVWFYLLKKFDPMFGESYISYVIRMIHLKKMPLPIDLIPVFYGNGKLQLFEEFDIWPELNAVFVMYFLFNCPFIPSKASPSQDKPIEGSEPIMKHADESIK
ncbi:uncharacterized protein LOC100302461 precursor [Acyrthosiphon pisum]|uniref:Uncharacterized protein n=1 Tax=Acyrthosiphon pisum TaxID=7029 RepID=C4WWS1_ACYPI|nr:uncharacterized protein LOC100302461 precursor [Acyrthosiphon pisum]BAH72341.1 hypothetical protein [Acyrthosiphon pisum]|eukprot:NP_001156672.1 uncharacterized protein LOC100302461 precursor [Acyrthosiphon pisum]